MERSYRTAEGTAYLLSSKPYFDQGALCRKTCVAGLYIALICNTVCLVAGVYTTLRPISFSWQGAGGEAITVSFNIAITLLNEIYGYIHGISLRWALQREGRLTFNSNLRLLTSSRTSRPNKWYTNLFMLCCIIGSYSSSSLVFLKDGSYEYDEETDDSPPTHVCGAAIISLAMCLLGQGIVAWWSLLNKLHVPTWSADPLDTVAACIQEGYLHQVSGRCMQSVHDAAAPSTPTLPRHKQRPAYAAHPEVRKVIWALWATVVLAILWAIIIWAIIKDGSVNGISDGGNWSLFSNDDTPFLNMGWDVDSETLPAVCYIWAFFFISGLQAVITLALHCVELRVNCITDEATWRLASSQGGLKRDRNILIKMGTSWPSITLLCFKPLVHWLYGLSITITFNAGVTMRPPQIFYLSASALLLALFATTIVRMSPKGPQPATFGHLQTLANLIDEWPAEGKRLFWGHKSDQGDFAHAGTSSGKLGEINFQVGYLGILWSRVPLGSLQHGDQWGRRREC
ncbi:hypothetical protein AYL99_04373 [Fonsecaea erecta]|uniref:Uncharacterized protein n=1 Tax=Fonsecaea erecta TaxID=1367422 RepID=A0A178ZQT3_9EURO|nr:hypothetical protein AYL99_04373 [Fonsecaea erecta]OAP62170.1 hypothetical protein AYL99_04373 [Fonsecaea erecta]